MKVKELIEKLKQVDPELEVEIAYTNRSHSYQASDSEEEREVSGVFVDTFGSCMIFELSRKPKLIEEIR